MASYIIDLAAERQHRADIRKTLQAIEDIRRLTKERQARIAAFLKSIELQAQDDTNWRMPIDGEVPFSGDAA